MLSPGRHHEEVPTDREENTRFRATLVSRAEGDLAFQAEERRKCTEDVAYLVNAYCWQFNPLKRGDEYGPFILRPAQHEALYELLDVIEHEEDAVMAKSREEGGTYLCIFLELWFAGFFRNQKILNISRNAEAVDDRSEPDSIFWKIDTTIENFPHWLLGRHPDPKKHRRTMRLYFPFTNSYITGTASTGKAGVGGRAHLIFCDEFSQVAEDREVRQRTASTAPSRIFNGTHVGIDTEFYRLTQTPEIRQIQLHWTQNPEKARGLYRFDPAHPTVPEILDKTYEFPPDYKFVLDGTPTGGPHPGVRSPWYDKKCVAIDDKRAVAMDLDINPTGSVSQFYDAVVISNLVQKTASPPLWRGDLEFDETTGQPRRLVESHDGKLKLWVNPLYNGTLPLAWYAMGADIANGTGATPSVATVVKAQPDGRAYKVAEYVDNWIAPEPFAAFAIALCRMFVGPEDDGARLVWEMAGSTGASFYKSLRNVGYSNIYLRKNDLKLVVIHTDQPGWHPSPTSRMRLHREYRGALKRGDYVNPSEYGLKNTLGYQYATNGGDVFHPESRSTRNPGDAGENHGDVTVADALSWLVRQELPEMKGESLGREDPDRAPLESTIAGRRKMAQDARRQSQRTVWVE